MFSELFSELFSRALAELRGALAELRRALAELRRALPELFFRALNNRYFQSYISELYLIAIIQSYISELRGLHIVDYT